jgi:thiamine pyrophosphokinase
MPKTIIFANGRMSRPETARRHIADGDTIVCADGGSLHALALGLSPHVVVGDLDSLPEDIERKLEASGSEIIRKPRQKDQTDLECAVQLCIERGAREIVIMAAFGGRIDQMLANCLLLARPEWRSVRLRIVEDEQEAFLLRGPDRCEIGGGAGDTLSLLVLDASVEGVTITGTEWKVSNGRFELGSTRPVSNVITNPPAVVSIESGTCLVVHIPARAAI